MLETGAALALLGLLLLLWWTTKVFPTPKPPPAESTINKEGAAAVAPPVVPGLPLLGNSLALGARGAAFLHDCHKKVRAGVANEEAMPSHLKITHEQHLQLTACPQPAAPPPCC
jgi:hypothetical protein